ncbi:MAG TPA: hypothetical protein VN783_08805 [Thermoanaerobaculia bacterium]|nr:hypothetical protein [Thermoanaerobaculia bacterium]
MLRNRFVVFFIAVVLVLGAVTPAAQAASVGRGFALDSLWSKGIAAFGQLWAGLRFADPGQERAKSTPRALASADTCGKDCLPPVLEDDGTNIDPNGHN